MFKGKFWLWAIIIAVFFTAQWLIESIPVWVHTDKVSVQVDMKSDNDLDAILSNQKIKKFQLSITNDNADIIISDSNEVIEGYERHDDYIYSPLVAYACAVSSYDDGFIAVPNTSNCYKIDLYSVLLAIEDGKQWSDLGINEKVAKGTTTLYIPNEQSPYYDDVIDLFYLTLNKGESLTDETMASLKNKVDNIVSKCHKIADINQAVNEEYGNATESHKILIGPEFLYTRGQNSSMGSGKNGRYTDTKQYRPIYFLDTVYVSANVYVKADENASEVLNNFLGTMKNDDDFLLTTGWRTKNYSYSMSDVYYETH